LAQALAQVYMAAAMHQLPRHSVGQSDKSLGPTTAARGKMSVRRSSVPVLRRSDSSTVSLEGGRGSGISTPKTASRVSGSLVRQPSSLWLLASLFRLRALPLLTVGVILFFACWEMAEAGLELRGAHGLSLLALLRVGTALSELQPEAQTLFEALADRLHPAAQQVAQLFFGPLGTTAVCSLAVTSSAAECLRDFRFGGHHGLVILSLSDTMHVLQRTGGPGPMVGLSLALAASLSAIAELASDLRPGAHHGVAVLAVAHLAENVQRIVEDRAMAAKTA